MFRKTTQCPRGGHGVVQGALTWRLWQVLWARDEAGGRGRIETGNEEPLGDTSDLEWGTSEAGQGAAGSGGWVWLRPSSLRAGVVSLGPGFEEGARSGHLPQRRADAHTEVLCDPCPLSPAYAQKGPGG